VFVASNPLHHLIRIIASVVLQKQHMAAETIKTEYLVDATLALFIEFDRAQAPHVLSVPRTHIDVSAIHGGCVKSFSHVPSSTDERQSTAIFVVLIHLHLGKSSNTFARFLTPSGNIDFATKAGAFTSKENKSNNFELSASARFENKFAPAIMKHWRHRK
jgi:hypothetical protein